ncbi:MAG: ABC transporter permease [Planctomycetes bacterium]|nr:ABC transporter permease [Planctomycetota bacterium]
MYKLLLCLRYLRTRYIALASIISVTLGVATLVVVNSVMSGFSSEMRDRIHGILADVVVETNSLDGVPNPDQLMELARQAAGDYIEAMTPTVEIYGMLSFEYAGQWITRPITLIGIDPVSKSRVGPLVNHLQNYRELRDGEMVVRPPLRAMTEPPSWELTAEAMEYRRHWVEQQQLFLEQLQATEERSEASKAEGVVRAGTVASADRDRSSSSAGPPKEQQAAAPTASAPPADPFAQDPFARQLAEEESEKTDPAAPWPARLYIGAGLVEFSYEDRETGRMRTVHMVQPGDDVVISTVTAGHPPEVCRFNATVVDLFKSGMSEYDASLVFCNIEALQEARGMIDPQTKAGSVTSIQIKLKNYDDAKEVVRRLRAVFPPSTFSVRTWEQKQGPLLAAVEVESAILNVLLFLIIAVAGFGILAIFFMIVVEKTRDIGILKALGASSGGVMSIFLSYGLALGVVGSGVGVCLGLLFVRYINEIETALSWIIGRKVFDERIYYFPEIPTHVDPWMVVWVAVGAMAIAVLASILPARRAAQLNPVEALRYE